MKIKNYEAAALSRTLAGIDLQDAKTESEIIVDLFITLLPATKEYDSALATLQKEAQGKSPEEVKNLVSAQAFDKIANDVSDIDFGLTIDQIKAIGKHFKSVADIALLYNLKK